jgi:hypothetical protein
MAGGREKAIAWLFECGTPEGPMPGRAAGKKRNTKRPEQSDGFVFVGFPERRRNFPIRPIHTRKTSPILHWPEAEDGMGDWDWETDWSRDLLERIVALLFALSGLADLAAGAPFHRRRQVLGILSHGEAEARAFLFGEAPIPAEAPGEAGDAARLAVRFRALALVLCALLAQAARSALPVVVGAQAGRPPHGISGPAVRRTAAPASPAPDT